MANNGIEGLVGLLLYFLVTSLSHRLLIKSAPGGHALYELVKILYYVREVVKMEYKILI